jgi:hypothetical protein
MMEVHMTELADDELAAGMTEADLNSSKHTANIVFFMLGAVSAAMLCAIRAKMTPKC